MVPHLYSQYWEAEADRCWRPKAEVSLCYTVKQCLKVWCRDVGRMLAYPAGRVGIPVIWAWWYKPKIYHLGVGRRRVRNPRSSLSTQQVTSPPGMHEALPQKHYLLLSHVGVVYMPQCVCEGQRTTCGNGFSFIVLQRLLDWMQALRFGLHYSAVSQPLKEDFTCP